MSPCKVALSKKCFDTFTMDSANLSIWLWIMWWACLIFYLPLVEEYLEFKVCCLSGTSRACHTWRRWNPTPWWLHWMWSWESSSLWGILKSNPQLLGNPITCSRTDLILEYAMDVVELHLCNIDWSSAHFVAPGTNCTSLLLPGCPWSNWPRKQIPMLPSGMILC